MSVPHLIDSVASATMHRDRDALDAAVARVLQQFLDAETVVVYRLVDDNGVKRAARRFAIQNSGLELGPIDMLEASSLPALVDVPAWRQAIAHEDVVQFNPDNGSDRHAVFPLWAEREIVGLLEISTREELHPRDVGLVTGIMRIVRNHLALLDYGERDTLTGLLNRKTFESSFDKLRVRNLNLSRDTASTEPSWLGVVDIDKFKTINDTYGHLFGDEVLLLVSRLMGKNLRLADQLFRFGGEEFVVVLDRASSQGAAIAFERLRSAIESYVFPQVGLVTISLGFTMIQPYDGPASCIERADAALYYAKHHGRNQTHGYEQLIESGLLKAKEERSEVELF